MFPRSVSAPMSEEPRRSTSSDVGRTAADPNRSADGERAPNTVLNGLIGGVVAIVLAFVPFSTVLGGGVAGYLEGGNYAAGAKVGAVAGIVAFVPLILVLGAALFFVPVVAVPGPRAQLALWVIVLVSVLATAAYAVGLSVIGGVLGAYLKSEL